MTNKRLFNKAILIHLNLYLVEGLKEIENQEILPPWIYNLRSVSHNYCLLNKFTKEEIETMKSIETEEMLLRMRTEVSFIAFSLHLVKLYIEQIEKKDRVVLNISDNKLLIGTNVWFKQMLSLKKTNESKYIKTKKIVEDSKQLADYLFNYLNERI
jgi:hypothetical protein